MAAAFASAETAVKSYNFSEVKQISKCSEGSQSPHSTTKLQGKEYKQTENTNN